MKTLISFLATIVLLVSAPTAALAQQNNLHGTTITRVLPTLRADAPDRTITVVVPWVGRKSLPTPWAFFFAGDPTEPGSPGEWYANKLLDEGIFVTGLGLGAACGSTGCADLMERFYQFVTAEYGLAPKMRIIATSNGGLGAYGYASRHPEHVERIGGIYPAVDWRTWPGVDKLQCFGGCYTDTMYTSEELLHQDDYNPINNLKVLAEHGVVLFHLHGGVDTVVPALENSILLQAEYRRLGGTADIMILPNKKHEPSWTFDPSMVRFLEGLAPILPREKVAGPVVFLRPGGG